jgi:hypothetical protein
MRLRPALRELDAPEAHVPTLSSESGCEVTSKTPQRKPRAKDGPAKDIQPMKGEANLLFKKHLEELGLGWNEEWQFHPTRKWRLDFVLYRDRALTGIAVEIEGGIWSRGRHTRGKGFQADLDKYNAAVMKGWRVLRFSTEDIIRGRAKAFLQEHLK